jgi:hypothetical protein
MSTSCACCPAAVALSYLLQMGGWQGVGGGGMRVSICALPSWKPPLFVSHGHSICATPRAFQANAASFCQRRQPTRAHAHKSAHEDAGHASAARASQPLQLRRVRSAALWSHSHRLHRTRTPPCTRLLQLLQLQVAQAVSLCMRPILSASVALCQCAGRRIKEALPRREISGKLNQQRYSDYLIQSNSADVPNASLLFHDSASRFKTKLD